MQNSTGRSISKRIRSQTTQERVAIDKKTNVNEPRSNTSALRPGKPFPAVLESLVLAYVTVSELAVLAQASSACCTLVCEFVERAHELVFLETHLRGRDSFRGLALLACKANSLRRMTVTFTSPSMVRQPLVEAVGRLVNRNSATLEVLSSPLCAFAAVAAELACCSNLVRLDMSASGQQSGHVGVNLTRCYCLQELVLPESLHDTDVVAVLGSVQSTSLRALEFYTLSSTVGYALFNEGFAGLQRLAVNKVTMRGQFLATVLAHMPALTELVLQPNQYNTYTDGWLTGVSESWPLPELVRIDSALPLPPLLAPKLRQFRGQQRPDQILSLICHSPLLETLADASEFPAEINKDVCTVLTRGVWRNLRELVLRQQIITPAALLSASEGWLALQTLHLTVQMTSLLEHQTLLERLLSLLPELESIDLKTENFLVEHADTLPHIRTPIVMRKLRALTTTHCHDGLFRCLVAPRLETLAIQDVFGGLIVTLGMPCTPQWSANLTSLRVVGLPDLDEASLLAVLKSCSRLQNLHIAFCSKFSTFFIDRLASIAPPSLLTITCNPFTNALFSVDSIVDLISCLPRLSELALSDATICNRVLRNEVLQQLRGDRRFAHTSVSAGDTIVIRSCESDHRWQ